MKEIEKRNLKIPFLGARKIKKEADNFRDQYGGKNVPVDIERIVDFDLDIPIIPEYGLKNQCGVEAGIASNWKGLYVDQECYENEKYALRLRFSIAHEIGHFVLHKEVYESLGIETIQDYYNLMQKDSDEVNTFFHNAESQANIFANMLLVPRETLLEKREALLELKKDVFSIDSVEDEEVLNQYLAVLLATDFLVSEQVIVIALKYLEKDLHY